MKRVALNSRHRHGPVLRDGKMYYCRCLNCDLVAQVHADSLWPGRSPKEHLIKSLAGKHCWVRRLELKGFVDGDGI